MRWFKFYSTLVWFQWEDQSFLPTVPNYDSCLLDLFLFFLSEILNHRLNERLPQVMPPEFGFKSCSVEWTTSLTRLPKEISALVTLPHPPDSFSRHKRRFLQREAIAVCVPDPCNSLLRAAMCVCVCVLDLGRSLPPMRLKKPVHFTHPPPFP